MLLINCNVELKLRRTRHCVLTVTANYKTNDNPTRIVFTSKDTKLLVAIVTLSAKGNQKLWKLLSEGFERSAYWNEYKAKSKNENTTNEYRYFLESNFVRVKRLFLFIQNKMIASEDLMTKSIIYQKILLENIISSSMVKTFMTNPLTLI